MSDWKRATKEIPFEGLRSELQKAIHDHIEKYTLGMILTDKIMCIQTDSEKVKRGLFGSAEIIYAGVVLTPRWIIWATSGAKAQTAVLSAQLRDVTVQDYAQSSFMKLIPDSGINLEGRFTDSAENISAFIGLDDEVGKKFMDAVIRAAQDAKK